MKWIYLFLTIPALVLLLVMLYFLQKAGVYKIEGDPEVGSDAGFYVEPEDIERNEFGGKD